MDTSSFIRGEPERAPNTYGEFAVPIIVCMYVCMIRRPRVNHADGKDRHGALRAPSTVADAGFLEGGFHCNAREKFSKPRPLLYKPRPFSIVLERNFLCQSSHFRPRFLLKHAKVSHRSSSLSSLAREGGST